MTHRSNEVYTFNGIFLPWGPDDHTPVYTTKNDTEAFKQGGFILIEILRPGVSVVQSIANGQLYVNELVIVGQTTLFNRPPAFRASAYNPNVGVPLPPARLYPNYVLPDEPYFQKIALAEKERSNITGNDVWSIYYRHPNGGTLQDLIETHHRYRRPVPEPFIWHVMEQLSEALHYMYRGRGRGDTSPPADIGPFPQQNPWRRLFHRKLTAESVYIDYEPRGQGPTPASGQIRNALPVIRIGNWEDSAIEGDTIPLVPAGRFGQNPNEWEDVFGFGQIIRRLMMAHVPLWNPNGNPCPNPGGALTEYTGDWSHRPDSRDIMSLQQLPGNPYSAMLFNLAEPFEVDNIQQRGPAAIIPGDNVVATNPMQGTTVPFQGSTQLNPNAQGVPAMFATDVHYVVNYIRGLARTAMNIYRGNNNDGYFETIDVSWTKPAVYPLALAKGANAPFLQGANPAFLLPTADAAELRTLHGGPMAIRPRPQAKAFNMTGARVPPA